MATKDKVIAISTIEHDGEVVLNYGDEVTPAVVKKLGDDLVNQWYDDGVLIEESLLPPHLRDRPEGNSDRTGFRVPGLSEQVAALDKKEAKLQAEGKTEEVTT